MWWVSAASLRDPAEVLPALALAAGTPERPDAPAVERIARELRGGSAFAVVDNLEHLLDAAPALQGLLDAAPGLMILATSRERCLVRAELVVVVDPLPTPVGDRAVEIAANPAVTIFFERANDAGGADPGADDLLAAARIVRQLDGMPLAVELAAAQRTMLTPAAIADLLEQAGIRALGRRRDGPERMRSLEAAIRWSADLLPGEARALFRLLSVFRGGFTAAAAGAVASAIHGRAGVAAGLPALLAASLVREVRRERGGTRFAMLEPVRMVAAMELGVSGEERAARDAHAAWAVPAASGASVRQLGPGDGQEAAIAWFAVERANLVAALDHLLTTRQSAAALPLAVALGFWWEHVGPAQEGLAWVSRAVSADDGQAPARDRWMVRFVAALLALNAGDYAEMRRVAGEALEISTEARDDEGEALATIAIALWEQTADGDVDGAIARLDRAIRIAEPVLARDPAAWLPLAFGSN
ncbi:MAG: ATP-binding protein, partial [Thermomicrobiales bacterium]